MSLDQVILAGVRAPVVRARLDQCRMAEANKGSIEVVASCPVELEPPYRPVQLERGLRLLQSDPQYIPAATPASPLVRWSLWPSPEDSPDPRASERFLKLLAGRGSRMVFELRGNAESVRLELVCSERDQTYVPAMFHACFPKSTLRRESSRRPTPIDGSRYPILGDCVLPPPYSHRLTTLDELGPSPLGLVALAMHNLAPPAEGLYQVVFQGISGRHDWHRNIQMLLDIEYLGSLWTDELSGRLGPQQVPAHALLAMSQARQLKAHADKPIFAAAWRLAVFGEPVAANAGLQNLLGVVHLFQHSGVPLKVLSQEHYQPHLSAQQAQEMLAHGLVYRPGFLVNSEELVALAHLPVGLLRERTVGILPRQDPLHLEVGSTDGLLLGFGTRAGQDYPVRLPEEHRRHHVHIMGTHGKGKSTFLEHAILQDIAHGEGVGVIDPHGDLVERLLCLIPAEAADRVIYLDFSDNAWVPLWNPLACPRHGDKVRHADALVGAIKELTTGWGNRIAYLLHRGIMGLLELPQASFQDLANILAPRTPEGEQLIASVRDVVHTPLARRFWNQEITTYGHADLHPPQHALGRLLSGGVVGSMLAQPRNTLDLRSIMDQGQILLVNLASLGPQIANTLGRLLVSLFQEAALSRHELPVGQRRVFRLYCDEAHRLLTESVEALTNESRKFGVTLQLAHHHLGQLSDGESDAEKALAGVGCTIVFHVNPWDAGRICKLLGDRVAAPDLAALGVGHAIARIGSEVVRVRMLPPCELPAHNAREQIIAASHQRYYHSPSVACPPATASLVRPVSTEPANEDFSYEEF